jgi:hypothetical protein
MRKQTLLICSNFADHGIRLLYWWHFSQVWYDVFFCSDISSTNCMLLSGPLIAYCCQLRDHPIARIWAIFGKLRGGHVLLLVVYYNGVYYAPTLMWDEKSMMNCHYICTWIVCRATCDVAVLVWTTGYNWVGNLFHMVFVAMCLDLRYQCSLPVQIFSNNITLWKISKIFRHVVIYIYVQMMNLYKTMQIMWPVQEVSECFYIFLISSWLMLIIFLQKANINIMFWRNVQAWFFKRIFCGPTRFFSQKASPDIFWIMGHTTNFCGF